jgi:hypothetical protein
VEFRPLESEEPPAELAATSPHILATIEGELLFR